MQGGGPRAGGRGGLWILLGVYVLWMGSLAAMWWLTVLNRGK